METINHPPHYGGDTVYEHIKVLEAWGLEDSYCLGNATKYIARHRKKGTPLEDLRKARWYLDHEIQRLEAIDLQIKLQQQYDDAKIKYDPKTPFGPGGGVRCSKPEPLWGFAKPATHLVPPDEWHANLEQCEQRIGELCVPWVTKVFEKGHIAYSYKDNELVRPALVARVVVHERGCKVSFFKPKHLDHHPLNPVEDLPSKSDEWRNDGLNHIYGTVKK